jgi:hypothetical protein
MKRNSMAMSIASVLFGAAVALLADGLAAQEPKGPPDQPGEPGKGKGVPFGPPPPGYTARTCDLAGLPNPPRCCFVGGTPLKEIPRKVATGPNKDKDRTQLPGGSSPDNASPCTQWDPYG